MKILVCNVQYLKANVIYNVTYKYGDYSKPNDKRQTNKNNGKSTKSEVTPNNGNFSQKKSHLFDHTDQTYIIHI